MQIILPNGLDWTPRPFPALQASVVMQRLSYLTETVLSNKISLNGCVSLTSLRGAAITQHFDRSEGGDVKQVH